MALPAGRYGVTKNQLLKIKKLPMNTMKLIEELAEKYDLLGTAAFKNSTSVVTQSTDLVESGAVKDIVGWGNKNLLLPNYSDGNSKSQNGVTFTKNSDGTVTISIAQSATGTAYYYMYLTLEDFIERGEKYIVNGFLNNNSITFSCNDKVDNAWGNTANSNGSDVEWTPRAEATAYGIWILVASGTTAGTYVVKPMISKDGGAYEPYHASVEDSLEQKADNSVIAPVEDGDNASQAYAVGQHFIRGGKFCTVTQAISSGGTLTEGNNYTTGDVADNIIGFTCRLVEINAPSDTTEVTNDIRTALGIATNPSWFSILYAEQYNSGNTIWYQLSNDRSATSYACKASADNGNAYRVKIDNVAYIKIRMLVAYRL